MAFLLTNDSTQDDALIWCDWLEEKGFDTAALREEIESPIASSGNLRKIDGDGDGDGDGYGDGDGDGYGDGGGYGYGYGGGAGYGYGYGGG